MLVRHCPRLRLHSSGRCRSARRDATPPAGAKPPRPAAPLNARCCVRPSCCGDAGTKQRLGKFRFTMATSDNPGRDFAELYRKLLELRIEGERARQKARKSLEEAL